MIIDLIKGWLASRPRNSQPTYIVLHHDGGRWGGTEPTLRKRGLSYHLYIHRSGRITKCVPFGRVAYHAGVTEAGADGAKVTNEKSIGICLENRGNGEAYTAAQLAALVEVLGEIVRNTPSLRALTTHRLITMNPDRSGRSRKIDPLGLDPQPYADGCGLKLWRPWDGAR